MPINNEELINFEKILENLVIIFSDNYALKFKLEKIVKRRDQHKLFLVKYLKLFQQAQDYSLQKERLKKLLNGSALKKLNDFQHLVSVANLNKTDLSIDEINRIEIYLLSIHNDYKLVRDEMQTLSDINVKLEKYFKKKKFDKIGDLLERGILDKMPNLIIMSQLEKDAKIASDKLLEEIRKFYEKFILNCHLLRSDMDRNLDDIDFRKRLQDLQTILVKRQPNDIEDYYKKLIQPEINSSNLGYSKEVLLESFSKDLLVQTYASNNAKFFIDMFIFSLSSESFWSSKFWRKHFEYYCFIMFNFKKEDFKRILKLLIENENKNHVLILKRAVLISCLYSQALEFFKDFKVVDENNNVLLMELEKSNRKLLIAHIDSLLKQLSTSELLFEVKDNIINEKNAALTIDIMRMMPDYGGCIKELDFSMNKLEVRHCFTKQFFDVLNEFKYRNVSEYSYFFRLIFYICAYDTKSDDRKSEAFSLEKFNDLRSYFDEPFLVNSNDLNDLVEGLRVLISMGSFALRLKCAMEILKTILERRKAEEDNSNETNTDSQTPAELSKEYKANLIKISVFKYFYSNRGKAINVNQFIMRLAETLNIHLFKYSLEYIDKKELITVLTENNKNFGIFIGRVSEFNIENDLVAGFGIPYYLTANEVITSSNDYKSIISILFSVFICNSITDRKEFMMNKQTYKSSFKELVSTVTKLETFYDKINNEKLSEYESDAKLLELIKSYCKHLKEISFGHIIDGFKGDFHESLVNRKKYADKIIKNFINYDLEHIITIIKSTNESNVAESVLIKSLNQIMQRKSKSLPEWADSTSSIGSKIDFLHFYYKYSQEEFDQWFKELNPHVVNTVMEELFAKRSDTINEFDKNVNAFENSSSIKHLQHNQAGALTLIFNELERKKDANIFMNIGTGQGKSLIIADTVRKLIQLNGSSTQVFVFTCYSHLAKRDQQSFSKFYETLGISSIYCARHTPVRDLLNKNVIYSDLDDFIHCVFSDAYHCLNSNRRFELPDFKSSILVLDEFDSLILDSDEIYQYNFGFEIKSLARGERLPVDKDKLKEYFGVCDALNSKFNNAFSNWYEYMKEIARKEKETNASARQEQDSLGKVHTFSGSFLNKLESEGVADLMPMILDPLSFFKEFKQTIGFSGSIQETGMRRFESLFSSQAVFYKIPPFFGKKRQEENRKLVDSPAKTIENKTRFIQAVLDHIKNRCQTQPILIFAETDKWSEHDEKSDFDLIYEAICKEKERLDDDRLSECEILKISNEKEVSENLSLIGYAKTITIATRIIARGADIQVYKEIANGLHLLITYYPKRQNIFIQMLGRTARMDKPGTYSIITRHGENYEREDDVKVNENKQVVHKLCDWFYREIRKSGKDATRFNPKWPFLLKVLFLYNKEKRLDKLIDFVKDELF